LDAAVKAKLVVSTKQHVVLTSNIWQFPDSKLILIFL